MGDIGGEGGGEGGTGGSRSSAPGSGVTGPVAYNHLLFDRHEIVLANGLPCESLYPGPMALGALDHEELEEIRMLFPETLDEDLSIGRPVRRILRDFEARALVDQKPLASAAA